MPNLKITIQVRSNVDDDEIDMSKNLSMKNYSNIERQT